jgi:hypothetical protein
MSLCKRLISSKIVQSLVSDSSASTCHEESSVIVAILDGIFEYGLHSVKYKMKPRTYV